MKRLAAMLFLFAFAVSAFAADVPSVKLEKVIVTEDGNVVRADTQASQSKVLSECYAAVARAAPTTTAEAVKGNHVAQGEFTATLLKCIFTRIEYDLPEVLGVKN